MTFEVEVKIQGKVLVLPNGKFTHQTRFLVNGIHKPNDVVHCSRNFPTRQEADENLRVWAQFLAELLKTQIGDAHEAHQRKTN